MVQVISLLQPRAPTARPDKSHASSAGSSLGAVRFWSVPWPFQWAAVGGGTLRQRAVGHVTSNWSPLRSALCSVALARCLRDWSGARGARAGRAVCLWWGARWQHQPFEIELTPCPDDAEQNFGTSSCFTWSHFQVQVCTLRCAPSKVKGGGGGCVRRPPQIDPICMENGVSNPR